MGNNLVSRADLHADTLTQSVCAAHRTLSYWQDNRHIDILNPHDSGKSRTYHPILAQQLADRRKWTHPKPKKLPFTMEMFAVLFHLLHPHQDTAGFFSREYCVFDWMRLGLLTGFRISEYGQKQTSKGERFRTVPSSGDVPEKYRGQPVAFVLSDFVFYDNAHKQVPYLAVWRSQCTGAIRFLEITWRYDKSSRNFSVRTY